MSMTPDEMISHIRHRTKFGEPIDEIVAGDITEYIQKCEEGRAAVREVASLVTDLTRIMGAGEAEKALLWFEKLFNAVDDDQLKFKDVDLSSRKVFQEIVQFDLKNASGDQ